jgi:hypothetical protein
MVGLERISDGQNGMVEKLDRGRVVEEVFKRWATREATQT